MPTAARISATDGAVGVAAVIVELRRSGGGGGLQLPTSILLKLLVHIQIMIKLGMDAFIYLFHRFYFKL